MAPWQVWALPPLEHVPGSMMLVVSSDFHLRTNIGRMVTCLPMTHVKVELDYRIPVVEPESGLTYWVQTDQIRTITAVMNPTGWTLADDEVRDITHSLKHMVAFA